MSEIAKANLNISDHFDILNKMNKTRSFRAKTKVFASKEKILSMNVSNKSLLDKLVEIDAGKWSSVNSPKNAKNDSASKRGIYN